MLVPRALGTSGAKQTLVAPRVLADVGTRVMKPYLCHSLSVGFGGDGGKGDKLKMA